MFGALLGGIILGIIESLAGYYIGMGWTEVVSRGVHLARPSFASGSVWQAGARGESLMGEETAEAMAFI